MILQILTVVLPWLLVALGCWILVQLLHKYGQVLLRLEALEARVARSGGAAPAAPAGLSPGTTAPAFELLDLAGQRHRLEHWRGQNLLLIFFNTHCSFCVKMAEQLAALPADGDDSRPAVVLICTGEADANRRFMAEHGVRCPVLLQKQNEVSGPYKASGTPTGYLIDGDGVIASPLAIGGDDLLALAAVRLPQGEAAPAEPQEAHGTEDGAHKGKANRGLHTSRLRRDGLKAGESAPSFRLPKVDGGEVALEDYRGRRVLLIFSDPECGPCMELAPALEQFHRDHPDIPVLMVSRRDAEANRAKAGQLGLTFPIVLQRQWEVSLQYAMFATPIAYLIDEQGVLAADVAVGPEPIKQLLAKAAAQGPDRGVPEGNGVVAQTAT
jgi:peroxiredoxin